MQSRAGKSQHHVKRIRRHLMTFPRAREHAVGHEGPHFISPAVVHRPCSFRWLLERLIIQVFSYEENRSRIESIFCEVCHTKEYLTHDVLKYIQKKYPINTDGRSPKPWPKGLSTLTCSALPERQLHVSPSSMIFCFTLPEVCIIMKRSPVEYYDGDCNKCRVREKKIRAATAVLLCCPSADMQPSQRKTRRI